MDVSVSDALTMNVTQMQVNDLNLSQVLVLQLCTFSNAYVLCYFSYFHNLKIYIFATIHFYIYFTSELTENELWTGTPKLQAVAVLAHKTGGAMLQSPCDLLGCPFLS